jgi:6-phosphofructokinase 1
MVQRLAYLMRAGSPDSLDRMVATNFGNLAYELLYRGRHGVMTAINDGVYAAVPLQRTMEGARRVDIDAYYDVQTYRPKLMRVQGKPMFLA